jgi:antitoxin component YwqK of YwqJK toxin-antitoxin module
MQIKKYILLVFFVILICSCNEERKIKEKILPTSSIVKIVLDDRDSGKRSEFFFDTVMKKKEGKAQIFYDNILQEEGNWVNDKQEGIWIFFDKTGKKTHEISFKNDQQDGTAIFYNSKGEIIEKSNWNKGKLNGESFEYDDTGKLRRKTQWNNGVMTSEEKY